MEEKIKQFSRKFFPEERKETANLIKERRASYFQHKNNFTERISELSLMAEEKKEDIQEIIQEIQGLEDDLSKCQKSIVLKVLNYFEIKKLREEIASKSLNSEQFEAEYQKIIDLIQPLEDQLKNKQELSEAKNYLEDFYQKKSKEWQEYQEEEASREVSNVAGSYDVFIVHGIHPNFVPGDNSLLNRNVDWKTKLKIVLALEPTLSASTISEGDSFRNMWARMGVVLNGGLIEKAMPLDSGTKAESLRKRTIGKLKMPDKVSEQIKEAIGLRGKESYNELVVQNPQVAGLYISVDETGNTIRRDVVDLKEIAQAAEDFGLPIFLIEGGVLKEANYNLDLDEMVSLKRIDPKELLKKKIKITPEQKESLKENLFIDPPFKLEFFDAQLFDARFHGSQTYIEINAPKNLSSFAGEIIEYQQDPGGESGEEKSSNEKVQKVNSLIGISSKIEYFIDGEKLLKRRKSKKFKEGFHGSDIRYIEKFDEFQSGFINLTEFMTEKLDRPINTNEDYVLSMEDAIIRWTKSKNDIVEEKYKGQIDFNNEVLERIACHLYGFAEQAEKFKDEDAQQKSFALANQILPHEQYVELLKKRIDNQGRFKITEKDLE